MPRADHVPFFDLAYNEFPCVKGCVEAGSMGGLPSVVNATLAPLGVTDIEMPLTPHRVWQTIQDATGT